jgi:hypothetical protein
MAVVCVTGAGQMLELSFPEIPGVCAEEIPLGLD